MSRPSTSSSTAAPPQRPIVARLAPCWGPAGTDRHRFGRWRLHDGLWQSRCLGCGTRQIRSTRPDGDDR